MCCCGGSVTDYNAIHITIEAKDSRYKMLEQMFHERMVNLEWFETNNWHNLQPQLVIHKNRNVHWILCVHEAEYYYDFTGDPHFKWIREFSEIASPHNIELLCEY